MDLQMILFIALIIIFFIIPLLTFIIKSAVKQGILEAYKIIKNDKDNNILYYYKDLGKNKVILPKKNVRKVFETPSNYFDIEIGKKMIISEN